MGTEVVTLGDLLRPRLRGVVVGINPSPISVARGHYYQGVLGRRFFGGLAEAGVLPSADGQSFEDDRAFAAGLGFTDLIKRPTARASGLSAAELEHGRTLLDQRLTDVQVPRVIFTFKKSATVLLGDFAGFGLIDRRLAGADVFVMSGPMAPVEHRRRAIAQLRDWWAA
jgi:TDG/mug DNA glycosylase family protein